MSWLRLWANFSMLKHELFSAAKTVTTLKFLHVLYLRFRRLLFGRRTETQLHHFEEAWCDSQSRWDWLPLLLTLAAGLWVLRFLWRKIHVQDEKKNAPDSAGPPFRGSSGVSSIPLTPLAPPMPPHSHVQQPFGSLGGYPMGYSSGYSNYGSNLYSNPYNPTINRYGRGF